MTEKRAAGIKSQHIVIIGNGIAGNSAALAIRRFDKDVNITMISSESSPLYSPCAFYKCLSGEMEKGKLFLKKFEDYSKEGVKVVFGQEVSAVDVKTREVSLRDRSIHFNKLILAIGSKALILPIKGVEKRGVFLLKTISDLEAILAWPVRKAVIIGSGPIGLEASIALREKGLEVTVIEVLNRILPRLFDDEPALILRKILEDHGISVLTEEKATEILGNGVVEGLTTNKRQIECDTVILAAGVRPNTELATQMGLEIGKLGGIKTDDYMMTSVEDVYACGDCVESRDIITGESTLSFLWYNAKRQGWIAGCNCAGRQNKFTGSLNATNLEIFGNYASSIGKGASCFEKRSDYNIIKRNFDSNYYRLIVVDDRLVGTQLINKTEHAGLLLSKMLRKDNLSELKEVVLDEKLLSMRPWHHWIRQYIT